VVAAGASLVTAAGAAVVAAAAATVAGDGVEADELFDEDVESLPQLAITNAVLRNMAARRPDR
jgi:hypothetical protein